MRIISGKLKGRRFEAPKSGTRPTADQVREALFNILYERINDACVLDCYAGSGGLSFESVSRGAKCVVAIDKDRRAAELIKETARRFGCEESISVLCTDTLRYLASCSGSFDVIFIDPPYDACLWESTAELIAQRSLLNANGVMICEHRREQKLSPSMSGFELCDERKYGTVVVSFYMAKERQI